ncbi:unnamed protein product [Prorocentrum cordatum]|uniref:Uncharacterized protein n=1 Tax=Prorocentrum cordatum TaxID=2364126 RepID=A0ABN9U6D2_9DINO|nr:unnamed protein product [Polarella glacialis]
MALDPPSLDLPVTDAGQLARAGSWQARAASTRQPGASAAPTPRGVVLGPPGAPEASRRPRVATAGRSSEGWSGRCPERVRGVDAERGWPSAGPRRVHAAATLARALSVEGHPQQKPLIRIVTTATSSKSACESGGGVCVV